MADIEKILDNINIPKQLLDKSEQLLKALLGPSMDEFSGMIADNVRLRRFKNQIKIFSKAQQILKENKLDPQKVSLKVLAPLIEYSSYEEEESLQNMWAKLVANIVSNSADIVFHQNCIAILNKLSAAEAQLLEDLFRDLQRQKRNRYLTQIKFHKEYEEKYPNSGHNPYPKKPHEYSTTSFSFNVGVFAKTNNISKNDFYFKISNLVALGLLKWETDVEVTAEKSYDDPEDKDIDVDVTVYNDDDFVFTSIGEKFISICKNA